MQAIDATIREYIYSGDPKAADLGLNIISGPVGPGKTSLIMSASGNLARPATPQVDAPCRQADAVCAKLA